MPTRIVINEDVTPPRSHPRLPYAKSRHFLTGNLVHGRLTRGSSDLDEPSLDAGALSPSSRSGPQGKIRRKRKLVGFRSSLLRELDVRKDDDDDDDDDHESMDDLSVLNGDNTTAQSLKGGLSSQDIRASPRLTGYLFATTAAAVMLISVVQFYREQLIDADPNSLIDAEEDLVDGNKFYSTRTGLVFKWKLWAAIYLSSAAVFFPLFTLLVHFDTMCLPWLWDKVFRDGSLAERNWIFFLLLLWTVTLHVQTSVFSVGEHQANVYFTTWIGFGATALTYGVWRESAGLLTLTEKTVKHLQRETSYNWIYTAVFSAVFAGSMTDIYANREVVDIRFRGEQVLVAQKTWTVILGVIWTEVALCAMVVGLNETLVNSWQLPCPIRRATGTFRLIFGWRQIEGVIILVSMAGKFYTIIRYTGVDGVVNGLSNAYFGIWGSFFNSVFAFGTWLKENQNMQWLAAEQTTSAGNSQPPR